MAISVDAKTAAQAAPVATSTVHTGAGGMSRPAAQRANGSRHRAPATIDALTHERRTRQRWPRNPNNGPVNSPLRMYRGLYPLVVTATMPVVKRSKVQTAISIGL